MEIEFVVDDYIETGKLIGDEKTIDALNAELTAAKEEIDLLLEKQTRMVFRTDYDADIASERAASEKLREALRYYARMKWFVNDGEYIHKVAEAALQERQGEE